MFLLIQKKHKSYNSANMGGKKCKTTCWNYPKWNNSHGSQNILVTNGKEVITTLRKTQHNKVFQYLLRSSILDSFPREELHTVNFFPEDSQILTKK